MFSLKKVFNPLKKITPKNELMSYFLKKEGREDFAYDLAIQSYEELRSSCQSQEDFMVFLLEDVVFTSLSATFYEEVLNTIHDNPKVAIALIDEFEKDTDSREQSIAALTELHVNYIMNHGKCQGCHACSNHNDVAEIIPYWKNRDLVFFSNLYIGMMTIRFAMEDLLYMGLAENRDLIGKVDRSSVLQMRQDIISWVESQS
ncbi:MAG: hypothetical protein OHK0056_21920 [Bacteriovoracaceae bacterium]